MYYGRKYPRSRHATALPAKGRVNGRHDSSDWELVEDLLDGPQDGWYMYWTGRRPHIVVQGATEDHYYFRQALDQLAVAYPELLEFQIEFDGPPKSVRELVDKEPTQNAHQRFYETTFYHGTSSVAAEQILRDGLRPRSETNVCPAYGSRSNWAPEGNCDYIYLTTQYHTASGAAREASVVHGGSAVILRVGPGLRLYDAAADVDSDDDDAMVSLQTMGSVAYTRTIAPHLIKEFATLENGTWTRTAAIEHLEGQQKERTAASPERDRQYRDAARTLIKKLRAALPDALHYKWKDTEILGRPIQYAEVWFDVGEVDPDYDDLVIHFLPLFRMKRASGEYRHKDDIASGGKDSITLWALDGEPKTQQQAVAEVANALDGLYAGGGTFLHELIHYYDQKRYPEGKSPKTYQPPDPRYYNSPQEFNAWFQTWAANMEKQLQDLVLKEDHPLERLRVFLMFFKDNPRDFAVKEVRSLHLDQKLMRHFYKRAAALWYDLRKQADIEGVADPVSGITTRAQLNDWFAVVENEVRKEFARQWEKYEDTREGLLAAVSNPEEWSGWNGLGNALSTHGRWWIVKRLDPKFKPDYDAMMEHLRRDVLSRYEDALPRAAATRDRDSDYEDVGFGEEGFWGNAGSGILFTTGDHILLLERSYEVEEPHTWGLPGGAIPEEDGRLKDAYESAQDETEEELGFSPSHTVVDKYVFQSGSFRYTTFICKVPPETMDVDFDLNWENDDWRWVGADELDQYDLHFGVVEVLNHKDPFR